MELVLKPDSSKDIKAYIKLAKKGDKNAFIKIIECSKASMYRIAVGILNNPQDVEDAFQNTIIKAYEGIIYLKKNEYFKTWLIRVLINECNSILRSNHKIIPIEEVQDNAKVPNEFSKLELTSAVNSLAEDLRVITTLFYFEDIPQKDIAKILDIPEGTVRSRLSRARNLPVVSSVFQFLSENNIIDKDYITYSSDLNMSKTSNGTTVTINSIVYDGIDLNIGYTIQSENEIKEIPVIMSETSMKINGKDIGFGGGDTGKFKDKKTYVGVASVNMTKDYLPKEHRNFIVGGNVTIPDNFTMDLNIKSIKMLSKNIEGNWNFKFKVSNEKIKTNVKSIKPNIDLSSLRPGLKVNEILITPINTALRTSETEDNDFNDCYLVFDDKGRSLTTKGSNTSGSSNTHTYYSQILFRNAYEDSKTLTFIPYVVSSKEFLKWKNNHSKGMFHFVTKETPLNLNGTTTLSEGKIGEYKITGVEFLNDKTLLHYECTNLLSAISPYGIDLIDSNDKEYNLTKGIVKETDPLNHKFTAQLPVLNKNDQFKLKAVDLEKKYTIKENMKFTIKIK